MAKIRKTVTLDDELVAEIESIGNSKFSEMVNEMLWLALKSYPVGMGTLREREQIRRYVTKQFGKDYKFACVDDRGSTVAFKEELEARQWVDNHTNYRLISWNS
jgi:hypothetical protein